MRDAEGATASRTALRGGWVVTMNAARDLFAPGVVVMEGARIAHVGPDEEWAPRPGDTAVDCRGLLLMPGLINAHTHACMTLFRGAGEDRPREAWGQTYTLPGQERARPEDYYWGAVLGGLEMLQAGVTTTADRFSHMEAISEALDATGMRAVVCHTVFGAGAEEELPRALALIERWGVSPERRVHCGLGPHAPNTCSDGLLRRMRVLAGESGARIYIHCAQSRSELAALRVRGHAGAVRCLAAAGLLGPDVVAAHCLYVDDEEVRLLAESGTWVAHCPVSNVKTEGRMAPVPAMLRAGVRVALGTDWAPANNGMDLFDEMKGAGLLNKLAAGDPTVVPADRLLAMATADAAAALGLSAQVGSLEPGKRADIVALGMDALHLQPWHNVAATLVYSAKGQDVRHVWVDGAPVVRDARPTRVDAGEVRIQVRRIQRRLGAP